MSGPSPEDVTFGRACLAFGLVTREQINACVADQQRLAGENRPYTLAQIMIGRQFISANQYHQVVERIRQRMAELAQQQQAQASQVIAAPRGLPPLPPEITQSGKYRRGQNGADLGQPVPQAVPSAQPARLTGTSGVVAAPGPAWPPGPPLPDPRAAPAPPPNTVRFALQSAGAPSEKEIVEAARTWDDAVSSVSADYEVVAEPIPGPGGHHVPSPQAVKERRDAGIRKILGIGDDVEQFRFGPYLILGELAAGGMGVIYRARASDTGQVYALKALMNVENANEKQLRRFIQEAQSAMRLDHPGIVRVHDIGIFENIPYFTMDLIQGQDLQHHLKAGTFPPPELLRIFIQVCQAVHYAHENGLIHRDLKPANIIVRDRDRYPILTDFGLAKNLDSSFKLTAEGAMVGTPLFLSPEQVSGKAQEVDRRCDVYGLGVMLYQILTARLPFTGRNPYEVYRKVLDEDPTPPSQVNPAVALDLEKVCLMALAKDKEERFPTALAMAEDIERHLRGEPTQARLPTPATVARARAGKGEAPKPGSVTRKRTVHRAAQDGQATGTVKLLIGVAVAVIVVAVVALIVLMVL